MARPRGASNASAPRQVDVEHVRQIAILHMEGKSWRKIAKALGMTENKLFQMRHRPAFKPVFDQMVAGQTQHGIITPEDFDHALMLRLPKILSVIDTALGDADPRISMEAAQWIIKRVDKSRAGGIEPLTPKVFEHLAQATADFAKRVEERRKWTKEEKWARLRERGIDPVDKNNPFVVQARAALPPPAKPEPAKPADWQALVDKPVN